MPGIKVDKKTLVAVKRVRSLISLEFDKDFSLNQVVQMMASDFLSRLTARTSEEAREVANLIAKFEEKKG